jgi:Raf kinase inhibitor-like YbhB/YbcL family protein
MRLSSAAFRDGSAIPAQYTCDGDDISPPLDWSNPPKSALSFVVLCDDPDAPAGTWHHWAAYDIPAQQTSLAEGASQRAAQRAFKQAVNDFRRTGYGGPCPPHDHGLHHYRFRLLALSIDRLAAGKNPSCRDIEREARKYVLAETTLVGVYER